MPTPRAKSTNRAREATPETYSSQWRRVESRSAPGRFYYIHEGTGQKVSEPPPPWEKVESRSKQGEWYYFNSRTGESSWHKPDLQTSNGGDSFSRSQASGRSQKHQRSLVRAKSEGGILVVDTSDHDYSDDPTQRTHLLGGVLRSNVSVQQKPRMKKKVTEADFPGVGYMRNGHLEEGVLFKAKQHEHQLQEPPLQRKVKPVGTPKTVMRGVQQVNEGSALPQKSPKKKGEPRDWEAASLKGAKFVCEAHRPHWHHKGKPNSSPRGCMRGGTWAHDAPPETPRGWQLDMNGEKEGEGHLKASLLVRSPREHETDFEEFLALGPHAACMSSHRFPRQHPPAGHSHLNGSEVVCDDAYPYTHQYPQSHFFHKPVQNIEGSRIEVIKPKKPEGRRTFREKDHIGGSGCFVVSEPEMRLLAHFVPSNLQHKSQDPGEPKWVALDRRRHIADKAEHLDGASATVVSAPENRLLSSFGTMKDAPMWARRQFQEWDHLEGAGIHEIVDSPRPQGSTSNTHRHRKCLSDFDHLHGAGIDAILQLTPRRQGKFVDSLRQQKAGAEWQWWMQEDEGGWYGAAKPSGGAPSRCAINSARESSSTRSGSPFSTHTPRCQQASGSVTPRSLRSQTPRSQAMGSITPRSQTPHSQAMRSTTPRSHTPRSQAMRSTTPRSQTPRSSAMGSATPRSQVSRSASHSRTSQSWQARSSGDSCSARSSSLAPSRCSQAASFVKSSMYSVA